MSKNIKKDKEKVVPLQPTTRTFCGFPLIEKNINQLWNWKTLETIKID